MNVLPDKLVELMNMLEEVANELEARINHDYKSRDRFPSEMNRWLGDMEVVVHARAILDKYRS